MLATVAERGASNKGVVQVAMSRNVSSCDDGRRTQDVGAHGVLEVPLDVDGALRRRQDLGAQRVARVDEVASGFARLPTHTAALPL